MCSRSPIVKNICVHRGTGVPPVVPKRWPNQVSTGGNPTSCGCTNRPLKLTALSSKVLASATACRKWARSISSWIPPTKYTINFVAKSFPETSIRFLFGSYKIPYHADSGLSMWLNPSSTSDLRSLSKIDYRESFFLNTRIPKALAKATWPTGRNKIFPSPPGFSKLNRRNSAVSSPLSILW